MKSRLYSLLSFIFLCFPILGFAGSSFVHFSPKDGATAYDAEGRLLFRVSVDQLSYDFAEKDFTFWGSDRIFAYNTKNALIILDKMGRQITRENIADVDLKSIQVKGGFLSYQKTKENRLETIVINEAGDELLRADW